MEEKTGKKALLDNQVDLAPYNHTSTYSINTDLANSLGYQFVDMKDYINELIDEYLKRTNA